MKTSFLLFFIATFCISQVSCTKDAELLTSKVSTNSNPTASITADALKNMREEANIKASGVIDYQITNFIPLSFDAQGNPTSARITMEGAGKIHPFGKLTVAGSFIFDFIRGVGYDFKTTYTDKHGNNIYVDGTSVLIGAPNGFPEYIVTEYITGGTGRYEHLKGGGESHVYQTQSVPTISGYYDVKWQISLKKEVSE
ncbi:MAG TPA: hypothetical protein V6C58_15275 [Allocoleopsis sp.]